MPNWCLNKVVIQDLKSSKKTIEKMDNVIHALNLCSINDSLEFFDSIIPRPRVYNDDWYEWNVKNWGTKWGAKELFFKVSDDRKKVTITFDTAWSPHTPVFDAICELGLDVTAKFWEHEGGYKGTYENGLINTKEYDPDQKKKNNNSFARWCSMDSPKGYTKQEMWHFIEMNNIEWATKGCLGSDDAYIELYNEATGVSLCKYPWDSSESFVEALAFVMDMHKKDDDDEASYADV